MTALTDQLGRPPPQRRSLHPRAHFELNFRKIVWGARVGLRVATLEDAGRLIQEQLLPLGDLGGVHAVDLGEFGRRLGTL
jgi:hypothetical protein